jgi:Ca2+-binding RTX toxin-like protein
VLNGGAGNDRFIATLNDGNDNYGGGTGIDTYDLSRIATAGAIITTTSATGAAIGSDLLSNIENIIGSQANDTITLAAGVNVIDGQAGDDTITAGAGNDIVSGGAGNDVFNYTMGDGADTVDGGAGFDTLNVVGATAADTLDVIFDGTAITSFEGGAVTGVESFTANLGAGTDTLTFAGTTAAIAVDLTAGTASGGFISLTGVENVVGGSGGDVLIDMAGVNNILTGGAGNDTFVVHDAGDVVGEASGLAGGVDTVQSFVSYTISDVDVENLTLLGTGNINGTGNAAANVITGNAGNNVLTGGAGIDTLIGGLGDDRFDFNALEESGVGAGNNDVIADFTGAGALGGDLIDLAGIDANGGVAGNQAFALIGTSAFSAAGQVRYLQVGTDTFVQANTDADTATIEFELKLAGLHALSGVDFVL